MNMHSLIYLKPIIRLKWGFHIHTVWMQLFWDAWNQEQLFSLYDAWICWGMWKGECCSFSSIKLSMSHLSLKSLPKNTPQMCVSIHISRLWWSVAVLALRITNTCTKRFDLFWRFKEVYKGKQLQLWNKYIWYELTSVRLCIKTRWFWELLISALTYLID